MDGLGVVKMALSKYELRRRIDWLVDFEKDEKPFFQNAKLAVNFALTIVMIGSVAAAYYLFKQILCGDSNLWFWIVAFGSFVLLWLLLWLRTLLYNLSKRHHQRTLEIEHLKRLKEDI